MKKRSKCKQTCKYSISFTSSTASIELLARSKCGESETITVKHMFNGKQTCLNYFISFGEHILKLYLIFKVFAQF